MSGPHNPPSLSVEDLSVNYEKTAVLFDINLTLPQGALVGIIGPNGAGKSTLLKAIMGIIHPLSGKVEFFGQTLKKSREKIAYVPQRSSVDWDFPITALDLVLMGSYGRLGGIKWTNEKDKREAMEALKMVEMEGFAGRQIGELSGGQQQRLFIARAFLQKADLYLLDEPFAGIDIATETALMSLFKTLRNQGKTVVVVHHDLSSAQAYFDWIILLNTCLIACGPIASTYTEQNLKRTYGQSAGLLDEAAHMARDKAKGVR